MGFSTKNNDSFLLVKKNKNEVVENSINQKIKYKVVSKEEIEKEKIKAYTTVL